MIASSPEQAVKLLDHAFNQGDVDAVLSFYEAGAVVLTEPGRPARRTGELRSFFEQAIASGASAKQLKTHVIEADGVALFLSRWALRRKNGTSDTKSQTLIATTVLRRQPDGNWKILIDNPAGPLVLGPE